MKTRTTLLLCAALLVATGAVHADWFVSLPVAVRDAILWTGDVEEGSLYDWSYPDFQHPGGGIFNTGSPPEAESVASSDVAHSGAWSARATIRNVFQAQNGSRAVRMFRWTDRPWDDGGEYFPLSAYYSTWIYLPHVYNPNKYPPWDPGDGGWWNIFQFKSKDTDGASQPIFTLNVDHDDALGTMELYLYTKYNTPTSWGQGSPIPLPAGQWVHLEALYQQSDRERGGRIVFWQDGRLVLNVPEVRTILAEPSNWSINNYTDHIAGGPVNGEATVYFDDAAVGRRRISGAFAPPVGAVPDGARTPGEPMLASRSTAGGIAVAWDATACPASSYHLLYGRTDDLASFEYDGAVCGLSPSGFDTAPLPAPASGEFIWWVLVAAEGPTESHHGFGADGLIRPAQALGLCGVTQQGETDACSP